MLCTLLSTAGEQLDHAKAETYMGHYFKTLGEISKYHHSARMKVYPCSSPPPYVFVG